MEPVTNGDYTLEPVDDLDPGQVTRVREIYEDGFAPHLRAGFATLTSGREAEESALALMRGAEPHGFVMLRPLGDSGWMFLRYLVAGQRGQGLGGTMWDQLMAWLGDRGHPLLVWDVEDPDEPGPGPDELTIRRRRIRFYERHGGRLLPVRGYGNPHGDDWTPMRLMAAPVAGGAWPETPAVVAAVYQHRWRLGLDDPRVAATEVTASAAPDHDQKGA